MTNLTFVRQKISLDEIMKSINSQRNESPGNDDLTSKDYRLF